MASCSAREAAIRASDLAFRRLHGLRQLRALNPEERENAEIEDDDDEDETEERTPGRRIRAAQRVLVPAGR